MYIVPTFEKPSGLGHYLVIGIQMLFKYKLRWVKIEEGLAPAPQISHIPQKKKIYSGKTYKKINK